MPKLAPTLGRANQPEGRRVLSRRLGLQQRGAFGGRGAPRGGRPRRGPRASRRRSTSAAAAAATTTARRAARGAPRLTPPAIGTPGRARAIWQGALAPPPQPRPPLLPPWPQWPVRRGGDQSKVDSPSSGPRHVRPRGRSPTQGRPPSRGHLGNRGATGRLNRGGLIDRVMELCGYE